MVLSFPGTAHLPWIPCRRHGPPLASGWGTNAREIGLLLSDLNEHEIARLCDLRARRRAGLWPAPVVETFAARHLISLHHTFAYHDPATVTFECVLTRQDPDGSAVHFVTYLTVPARNAIEPSAESVVREYGRRFIEQDVRRTTAREPARNGLRPSAAVKRELGLAVSTFWEAGRFIAFLGEDAFTDLIDDLVRERSER